jgi:hypothetical protein
MSRGVLGGCIVALVLAACGGSTPGTAIGSLGARNGVLFIRDVLAPVLLNGVCDYTGDPTAAALSVGEADVSFASLTTYSPEILAGNELSADAGSAPPIQVTSTLTNVLDMNGGDIASLLATMCAASDAAACATAQQLGKQLATPTTPFTTAASALVPASTREGGGYAPIAVTLVDAATVSVLRAYFENALMISGAKALETEIQLIPTIQLSGTTASGVSVVSQAYELPVTFTYGGLVSNLQTDPEVAAGYCLDTMDQPTGRQVCVPGQEVSSSVPSVAGVPACPGS